MRDRAVGLGVPLLGVLAEAECVAEPLDRAGRVLVGEHRDDPLHGSPRRTRFEARQPVLREASPTPERSSGRRCGARGICSSPSRTPRARAAACADAGHQRRRDWRRIRNRGLGTPLVGLVGPRQLLALEDQYGVRRDAPARRAAAAGELLAARAVAVDDGVERLGQLEPDAAAETAAAHRAGVSTSGGDVAVPLLEPLPEVA